MYWKTCKDYQLDFETFFLWHWCLLLEDGGVRTLGVDGRGGGSPWDRRRWRGWQKSLWPAGTWLTLPPSLLTTNRPCMLMTFCYLVFSPSPGKVSYHIWHSGDAPTTACTWLNFPHRWYWNICVQFGWRMLKMSNFEKRGRKLDEWKKKKFMIVTSKNEFLTHPNSILAHPTPSRTIAGFYPHEPQPLLTEELNKERAVLWSGEKITLLTLCGRPADSSLQGISSRGCLERDGRRGRPERGEKGEMIELAKEWKDEKEWSKEDRRGGKHKIPSRQKFRGKIRQILNIYGN